MSTKRLWWLLVLCAMATAPVQSQDEAVVEEEEVRDLLEVGIYGGVGLVSGGAKDYFDTLGAKTAIAVGGDLGYFFTHDLAVGLSFVANFHSIDTETEAKDMHHYFYSPRLYGKYYFFGESEFAPYVKAHAGVDIPKFATRVFDQDYGFKFRSLTYDPVFAWGLGGGVFYYSSESSGLFLEANYHMSMTDGTEAEYQGQTFTFQDNTSIIDIHAGIKVFFGGE